MSLIIRISFIVLLSISPVIVASQTAEQENTTDTGMYEIKQNTAGQDLENSLETNVGGLHLGIKYQPFFNDLAFYNETKQLTDQNILVNHAWGASINYYFNNWFGLHTEVISHKSMYELLLEGNQKREVKISYVNVPVMLSVNSNYGKALSINLTAGPYVGLNTNYSFEDKGSNDAVHSSIPTMAVNPLEFGLAYGSGLSFGFGALNRLHLNIGYRGTTGLTNVNDSQAFIGENQFSILGSKSRNRTSGAYIGVMAKF